MTNDRTLRESFLHALTEGILPHWYPLVIDRECGGYFTNVRCDWTLEQEQEKMIVSQARHVWTTATVAGFLGRGEFGEYAEHGYKFLRDVMWDARYGGFFQIRDRNGGMSDVRGWRDEKRTYGNAFAVFGLAALHRLTGAQDVLDMAMRAFDWIEEHACDPAGKGYEQFLTREGEPFNRSSPHHTLADDGNEVGYKDQNSSIHLLEAYTELLSVWDAPGVRRQLATLLLLIRDTMTDPRGFLRLFFHHDWTPVSFQHAPEDIRKANVGLDHVSFGHDCETAFLMLEASYVLGMGNDVRTLTVARQMLDHALANGFDREVGGFYDGGYYFCGEQRCTIIRDTKNWWAQAEGLNALLLFSRIFPDGGYRSFFEQQWAYVQRFVLDPVHGDWFEGGIDKQPHFVTGRKSHMWKCTYHTCRALMNCALMTADGVPSGAGAGWASKHRAQTAFIEHWRVVAEAAK